MTHQEKIKLTTKKKGTRIKYFTSFSGQTNNGGELSYLIIDTSGAKKIVYSELDTITKRDSSNYFHYNTGLTVYSGSTITEDKNQLNQSSKSLIEKNYINRINNEYLISIGGTGNTSAIQTYVQFEDVELEDMYIDLQLTRSINTLNTLSIHNLAINELPEQTSETGVLFGRLVAIQNILDENGEKVIIPLKNTIVAIFTPSAEYPTISSLDDDGNRIALNLKENIAVNLSNNYSPYFNEQSYSTDYRYLKSTSKIKNIPEMFKYTSITNENGEFIIHNVPTGEQTFMYEVNLLKQGLTTDEVALNFFSYPTEENPNIDKVPHFFFRELAVNIVPSWGVNQTGYTELNIRVALDLRKWCTYTVSPIAYKTKTIEDMFAEGTTTPLTVLVRDMTKKLELNNRPKVEIVEIQDVYDRNSEQVLEWNNEFKQRKNKVEFTSSNFNYFKLPANLYDPNGINSRGEKGVWLASYQFKILYGNQDIAYKSTGFEREWFTNGAIGRSHFDLNKNANFGDALANPPIGKIGTFPYEKPWTINYPEPYKIPAVPSQINPGKIINGSSIKPEEPMFLDGDLVGRFITNNTSPSGYGNQNFQGNNYSFNQFAREVTTHGIYKYEENDQWDEQWSNGFIPVIDNPIRQSNGLPPINVVNGERWQRLECGNAYWLKPEGWPRVVTQNGDVDFLSDGDQIKSNPPTSPNWGPQSYADGVYKFRENIMLRMDPSAPYYKQGSIDIYRIIDPTKIADRLPPPVEKFVKINIQDLISEIERPGNINWLTVGNPLAAVPARQQFFRVSQASVIIKNLGTNRALINLGQDIETIEPNQQFFFADSITPFSHIILPSNSDFNPATNSYEKAKYEITFWSILTDSTYGGMHSPGLGDVGFGGVVQFNLKANTENQIPDYYVVQAIPTVVNLIDGNGSLASQNNILANINNAPAKLAINGFAYCLWSKYYTPQLGYATEFPFAKQGNNDWISSYYNGGSVYTKNPSIYVLPAPLQEVGFTYSFGNLNYGYII